MDRPVDQRKRYGIKMAPIECTKAYKRVMGFDHAKVDTASYILVNEKATKLPNGDTCSGTRTHVNLYDGNAGPGFDPDKTTYPLGTEKILSQKLKGYTEIPISQCPVAKAL